MCMGAAKDPGAHSQPPSPVARPFWDCGSPVGVSRGPQEVGHLCWIQTDFASVWHPYPALPTLVWTPLLSVPLGQQTGPQPHSIPGGA